MSELKELLLAPDKRALVIRDAEALVDSEVQGKGGISGFAIKAGYKAATSVKPSLVRDALNNLIDRFVDRIEPFYQEWKGGGPSGGFDQFLIGRSKAVANALLGVTDERARSASGVVKKTYEKLRPQGEKNVEAAVPGLARLIQRHL